MLTATKVMLYGSKALWVRVQQQGINGDYVKKIFTGLMHSETISQSKGMAVMMLMICIFVSFCFSFSDIMYYT